jgi:putative MATE family efflux protein
MHTNNTTTRQSGGIWTFIKSSLNGEERDYTTGNIRKAVFLLAIPMVLEMGMESVFAVVDLYFVGKLPGSQYNIQTVGLVESVLSVVYALAVGAAMAATATVARRIGEKDKKAAAHAAMQSLLVGIGIAVVVSIAGLYLAPDILRWMGADPETIRIGTPFTRIMMGTNIVIVLLFLINGIFRGAGDASMAMKSLMIANFANIVLDPVMIFGLGPIPAMGLTGAGLATAIGRGIGVVYQLYHLFYGKSQVRLNWADIKPDWSIMGSLVKIGAPGTAQFVIGSCSWIVLAKLVAETGHSAASAGYQTALRILVFSSFRHGDSQMQRLPWWDRISAPKSPIGRWNRFIPPSATA